MKQEPFDLAFNRMFKWFGSDALPSQLKIELDLYKKLLKDRWMLALAFDS